MLFQADLKRRERDNVISQKEVVDLQKQVTFSSFSCS